MIIGCWRNCWCTFPSKLFVNTLFIRFIKTVWLMKIFNCWLVNYWMTNHKCLPPTSSANNWYNLLTFDECLEVFPIINPHKSCRYPINNDDKYQTPTQNKSKNSAKQILPIFLVSFQKNLQDEIHQKEREREGDPLNLQPSTPSGGHQRGRRHESNGKTSHVPFCLEYNNIVKS